MTETTGEQHRNPPSTFKVTQVPERPDHSPKPGIHLRETVTNFLKSRFPAAREAYMNHLYDRVVPRLPQQIRGVAIRLEKPFRVYAKAAGITGFAQDIMYTTAAAGGTALIGYEIVKRLKMHREKQPSQPVPLLTQTNDAVMADNVHKATKIIDPKRLRRRTGPKNDTLKSKTPFETSLKNPRDKLTRVLRTLLAEPSKMLADGGSSRVEVPLNTGERLMSPAVQNRLDAMQAIRNIVEPDAIPPLLFQTLESAMRGLTPTSQKGIFRQFFAKGDSLFDAWQFSGKGVGEYFSALQQDNRGGIRQALGFIRDTVIPTTSDPDAINAIIRSAFGVDALKIGNQLLPAAQRGSASPERCLSAYLQQSI